MTRVVFIRAGQHKMTFKEMPDKEAWQAEREGWGQVADDPRTNAHSYSVSIEQDHIEKADAYFNRAQQGYENRELSSGPSPSPVERSSPLAEPDGGDDAPQRQAGKVSPPSEPIRKATYTTKKQTVRKPTKK
jgi:hypothetical protein